MQGKWSSDPWRVECKNDYIYGRGVTDDKGPILATLFAVKELWVRLRCNGACVVLVLMTCDSIYLEMIVYAYVMVYPLVA